jgi:hypothetical protein
MLIEAVGRTGKWVSCRLCGGTWPFESEFEAARWARLHSELHAEMTRLTRKGRA